VEKILLTDSKAIHRRYVGRGRIDAGDDRLRQHPAMGFADRHLLASERLCGIANNGGGLVE
jgi:hypothetical protein